MKNPKRGPFDLSIDLEKIPSYRSRFTSLNGVVPQANLKMKQESTAPARDADKNLREKFCTGTNPYSLPSIILRKKGVKA